jgi:hypothetical protein
MHCPSAGRFCRCCAQDVSSLHTLPIDPRACPHRPLHVLRSKCKVVKVASQNFWKDPTKKSGYTRCAACGWCTAAASATCYSICDGS